MLVFVTKEIFKYSVVFVYALVGYSLTFLVMYYVVSHASFNNFWHTFPYTTFVFLQGDSLGDYKIFGVSKAGKLEMIRGTWHIYITGRLSNMRFASIITSVLFVIVVIMALMNVLVALAVRGDEELNPLNAELNPICHLLALLAHDFLHISRIRVKSLTLRLLMSYIYIIYIYIYGAPILDVSRSHTTTHHSR